MLRFQHQLPAIRAVLNRLFRRLKQAGGGASVAGGVRSRAKNRDKLLRALRESRFVHIATHGEQTVAPLSSAPHLARKNTTKCSRASSPRTCAGGPVTSACETALGRFDVADNLQGLAAVLFLSGVQAIVGTLWDVETNAAECFFTTLYAGLAGGSSRIQAFHAAQAETRRRHPYNRDWGLTSWETERLTTAGRSGRAVREELAPGPLRSS
jgi:CHAT domain-containing protein